VTVADTQLLLSAEDLLVQLQGMGIEYKTFAHPPLYTVEQSRQIRRSMPGAHVKNLFLRNKKGKMWLLTCLEDRKIDLKSVRWKLDSGSLSFCSPERLMQYLGVIPGAVTPFGVINDTGAEVQVVLDKTLLEMNPLNFHPLDNSKTTAISSGDLIKFLNATHHPPIVMDFANPGETDTCSMRET